jgi:hypothetical protein
MKHSATLITLACALLFAFKVNAAEELGAPPPEPAGTVITPVTGDTIQQELDQRLKDRFAAAAGSSPYLTAEQAKKAGWGFISDHFGEIDKKRNGTVTIDEIQAFMDARTPGEPKAARARANAAKTTIQKIE